MRTLPWWYQLAEAVTASLTLAFLAATHLADPGALPAKSTKGDFWRCPLPVAT